VYGSTVGIGEPAPVGIYVYGLIVGIGEPAPIGI